MLHPCSLTMANSTSTNEKGMIHRAQYIRRAIHVRTALQLPVNSWQANDAAVSHECIAACLYASVRGTPRTELSFKVLRWPTCQLLLAWTTLHARVSVLGSSSLTVLTG